MLKRHWSKHRMLDLVPGPNLYVEPMARAIGRSDQLCFGATSRLMEDIFLLTPDERQGKLTTRWKGLKLQTSCPAIFWFQLNSSNGTPRILHLGGKCQSLRRRRMRPSRVLSATDLPQGSDDFRLR